MAEEKSHWRDRLKRMAPGVPFLFGLGQSVSGVESPVIGFVLMGVAAVWAVGSVIAPPLTARGLDAVAGQVASRLVLPETKGNMRLAALEVRGELRSVQTTLAGLRSLPLFEATGSPLPASEWSRHRGTLGRELSTADYDTVLLAYELANQINLMASQALKTTTTGTLEARAEETAKRLDEQIDEASKRLGTYAD